MSKELQQLRPEEMVGLVVKGVCADWGAFVINLGDGKVVACVPDADEEGDVTLVYREEPTPNQLVHAGVIDGAEADRMYEEREKKNRDECRDRAIVQLRYLMGKYPEEAKAYGGE